MAQDFSGPLCIYNMESHTNRK